MLFWFRLLLYCCYLLFVFCSVVLSDNEIVVHASAKDATAGAFSPIAGFDSVFYGLKDMDGEWIAHTYEETNDVFVFTCYDMSQSDYCWGVRLECVEHNIDG